MDEPQDQPQDQDDERRADAAPHARPRDDTLRDTLAKQSLMLGALSRLGNVTQAAAEADINRRTHQRWVTADEQYAADVADAMEMFRDSIRQAIREAAMGRPAQGDSPAVKPSERILELMAKGNLPEYRETRLGDPGGAAPDLSLGLTERMRSLMMAEWDALEAREAEAARARGGD